MYSLSKNRRLHEAEEFSAVIHFQCKASGRFIQIYAKPNDLTYSRLGLIVAKRVEKHAVRRNRVKRLLRETFRMNQQDQNTKMMDWVIRLRHPITKDDSCHLTTEAKLLMHKLQRCHD